ncbi:hypothetical protein D3C80_2083230 [compost metagenome]
MLEAFAGHRRHAHRALWLALQGAFGHQALQGGAHRHRAGTPGGGEIADLQALAGFELTCQQAFA